MGVPEAAVNDGSLQRSAKLLLFVSVVLIMVGLAGLQAGICVIIFSRPAEYDFEWPVSSCSGIWSPLIAMALGIVGMIAFSRDDFSGEVYTPRRWVTVFWVLTICTLSSSTQHFAYSCQTLASCASESLDVCKVWTTAQPLLVAEGFCVLFGSIVMVLCISIFVYLLSDRRLYKLMGVRYHGCCGHKGNCVEA